MITTIVVVIVTVDVIVDVTVDVDVGVVPRQRLTLILRIFFPV